MKQIIEYLKNPIELSDIDNVIDFPETKIDLHYQKLLSLIPEGGDDSDKVNKQNAKPTPKPSVNQIWLTKLGPFFALSIAPDNEDREILC